MILTYTAKNVHILIYLAVFINSCNQIFYKFNRLFPYESQESEFDLAMKKCHGPPKVINRTFLAKIFKSYVLEFSYIGFCHKRPTQGHYLNYLCITSVHNATYQISRQSVHCFQRRRVLKAFTKNRHGSHIDHVTWTVFPQSK